MGPGPWQCDGHCALTRHAAQRLAIRLLAPLGADAERAIGVRVRSNCKLLPAGQCGAGPRCGHIPMKIDPQGNSCDLPGWPYSCMNSDFGGPRIQANFGACPVPAGEHGIGVLLAAGQHRPVLVDGKPVTAWVTVRTTLP